MSLDDDEDDGEDDLDDEPINNQAGRGHGGIASEATPADRQDDGNAEYKSANNFLHELHALHQHRLMFSSSSPLFPHQHPSFSLMQPQPPAKSTHSPPLEPPRTHLKGDVAHAFAAESMALDELQSVQERYVDANKFRWGRFCVEWMF